MKPAAWLGIAFLGVVVAVILFSTFHQERVSCRVCVTFHGRQDCRTASATNRQEAVRTAVTGACALLAGGVTESIQCENTKPDSVEWLAN
jgi:dihydroorotase-like cyclic amidohydrolase